MMSQYMLAAAMLLANAPLSLAQVVLTDPVNNMCFRWWHQSVIKNNILYIDGGQESFSNYTNYTISTTNLYANGSSYGTSYVGYNEYLIAIPLNETFNLFQANLTETVIPKTNVAVGNSTAPQLVTGSLFAGPDSENIWQYGGTTSWWNMSFPGFQWPQDDYYTLWSYNTSDEVWTEHSVNDAAPWRPSAGAHAEALDQGLAFYFNGELDSGSSTETQSFGSNEKVFLEGMVVLNLTDGTARNVSTQAVSGSQPRSRGILQYVPGIGEKGILVAIGGTWKNVTDRDQTDQSNFVDMGTIDVFDIASLYSSNTSAPASAWYSQAASGQTPGDRASFCSVLASAPDNSSHNIYIISGNNQVTNTFYDDVYVLSLPSFTWTNLYNSSSGRYGHTCHRVNNRQTFVVGGSTWYQFTEGGCDFESHGIGILDITDITYPTTYTPTDAEYQLPGALVSTIGGSPTGSATLTAPSSGYQNLQLATLFNNPSAYRASAPSNSTSTTTPTPTPHHASAGAIAGGVIGGVVGLALIIAVAFFCLRSNSRRRRAPAGAPGKNGSFMDPYASQPMISHHPSHQDSMSMGTGYISPVTSGRHTGTDGGTYSDYNTSELGRGSGYGGAGRPGYAGVHELANLRHGQVEDYDVKSPGVAEMEGLDTPQQLPGGEHDVAAELDGDETRGRFEMP